MKSIQEWLDINYPKISENRWVDTRNLVISLDFNSVESELFQNEAEFNFQGFTNLEEISCNLNQFYYFLKNGLEKLPLKTKRIVFYECAVDKAKTDAIYNLYCRMLRIFSSSYLKREPFSNGEIVKHFFDVKVWKLNYERDLQDKTGNKYSTFYSKELEMKNQLLENIKDGYSNLVLQFTNKLSLKERELENKTEELKDNNSRNDNLCRMIKNSNEENKNLKNLTEYLEKVIRDAEEEKELITNESKNKDKDYEEVIQKLTETNESNLKFKDKKLGILKEEIEELKKELLVAKSVTEYGKNSIYCMKKKEEITILKWEKQELENELKNTKKRNEGLEEDLDKLSSYYNKEESLDSFQEYTNRDRKGSGVSISAIKTAIKQISSSSSGKKPPFNILSANPSNQNVLENQLLSEEPQIMETINESNTLESKVEIQPKK